MKNCQNIQQELSAYLDGELTPSLRAEVEAHLASCAHCQQELQEMKTLATGVAALPQLQPTSRFLAEVRRKIARDEKPEPIHWQDHVFRPLWLKVPLEVAALIVVIVLVMRVGAPPPTQKFAQLEPAKTEKREYDRMDGVSAETAAKVSPSDALKSITANEAPAAPGAKAELASSRAGLEKKEKSIGATETPGLAIAGDKKQSMDELAAGRMVVSGANSQTTEGANGIPAFSNRGELFAPLPSAASPDGGMARRLEFAQSKPGETVTVHAQNINDVRSLAQRLAARCNGRVDAVPPSKDASGQSLFVELPPEYVAAFKLELLKVYGQSAKLARSGNNEQLPSTSAGAPSSGVLTGSAVTTNSINAPSPLGLRDDATTSAPATVLEIRVVTPAN